MLTAPASVSRKALQTAGMTKSDIDLWELNEAFASVSPAISLPGLEIGFWELERHGAVLFQVLGFVGDAHFSPAQLLENAIVRYPLANHGFTQDYSWGCKNWSYF